MDDEEGTSAPPLTLAEALHLINQLQTTVGQLKMALQTRERIGQAKGVLIERLKVTEDEAFELLVHVSQRTHTKLVEVAEQLLFCGALPTHNNRPGLPQTSDGFQLGGTE